MAKKHIVLVICNRNKHNDKFSQDPDTRCLVFYIPLCRKFNTETFQLFMGYQWILCHTLGGQTRQEAGSWALVRWLVASNTSRWHYFYLLIFSIQKSQCPLGVLKATRVLGFRDGKSRTTVLRYMCLLRKLLTLWFNEDLSRSVKIYCFRLQFATWASSFFETDQCCCDYLDAKHGGV